MNMSKKEAIRQIELLKEYVENIDEKPFTRLMLLELSPTSKRLKVTNECTASYVIRCGFRREDDTFRLVSAESLQPWSNWRDGKRAADMAEYLNESGYKIVEEQP